ncbi:MAG: hypothetical protein EAZ62_00495 [Sphingobacteriia bacterium]|nr:MAG: hypothetical protein EAZ62_00495 [Sphingobacteriia bacterium]
MQKAVLFFCILAAVFNTTVFSQSVKSPKNPGLLVGTAVTGQPLHPLVGAQVKLFADSQLVKQVLTDKNGYFELAALPMGRFRLHIESIGLVTLVMDSIHIRPERFDFNLGDVVLTAASNQLQEVVVYSEKPLMEIKEGRMVYNVGESALSAGSSTAELLRNIPLVSNDPNGRILLKGREPRILIDEKPTDLSPQQLQDLLESLPGSSIEKIELMTNPPPQYAGEAGGVINIVTKKGKIGWIGRVGVSYGTRGEMALNANLSYRNKKWNWQQTLGINYSKLGGLNQSYRTNLYADSVNYFRNQSHFINSNVRPTWRSQLDWDQTPLRQWGLVVQLNGTDFSNNGDALLSNLNQFQALYRQSQRNNQTAGTNGSLQATISLLQKGKKRKGEQHRVFLSGTTSKNEQERNFQQIYFLPKGQDSLQQQVTKGSNQQASLRWEYVLPLNNKLQLAAGSFAQVQVLDNQLNTFFYKASDASWALNPLLSNQFRFRQTIWNARVSLNIQMKHGLRLSAGINAEHTAMGFRFQQPLVPEVSNSYLNALPNISLRKEWNKALSTTLLYRKTLRRPGVSELNPNIDYSDPYNLRFGNPFLLPTLADQVDWNWNWIKGKFNINASLGYNRNQQVFNTIRSLIEGGKTTVTWLNIDQREEWEISFFGGWAFNKQWRINGSTAAVYNVYGAAEIARYGYRNGMSWNNTVNMAFNPSPMWTIEAISRFNAFADPQGNSRSNLGFNLGIQRKLMNRRLVLGLNWIDWFTPQQFTVNSAGPRFVQQAINTSNTRNIRFSVNFQLNRQTAKSVLTNQEKKSAINKAKKA